LTFGQIATNIEKFHIFFSKIGIEKGDKITLCARNSARWGQTFFAISSYEAVVVPLLNDFTPEAVANLTLHSESRILFTDKETWEKIDKETVKDLKAVICNNDYSLLYSSEKSVAESYDKLDTEFGKKYPMGFDRDNVNYPRDNFQNLAVINYTSGTTSAPKGVMISYLNLSTIVEFGGKHMPCSKKESLVSMLPMGHIYGLIFEFLYPICNGATVYFLGKTPSPSKLIKALKEIKPYLVVTVPLVMEKIYKSSLLPIVSKWYMRIILAIPGINTLIYKKMGRKFMETFGGNVREIILGGAALNPGADKLFHKMGLPYTVGYGMTEATPLLAYAPWRTYIPGSCGRPIECVEVRIDSEDPIHIAGEIQAKGSSICSGYYKNEEASANAFTEDGWLRTGDLGVCDKDGNIFIKGRSKTMILSANGQNIYPEELESTINEHDFIAESLVVDRSGKLVALLYLDQDAIKKAGLDEEAVSDIPEKVRMSCNRVFPNYSQITKVEVVLNAFEKTPKMSIKRFMYK